MPQIERLAHIGLHVFEIAPMLEFYRDILGLQVSDVDEESGLYFLSSHPDEEHHEVVLCPGRTAELTDRYLQQVSFRCPSLRDVVEYYQVLRDAQVAIRYTVTHGNAIGIYFYDPENNLVEVYWPTGLSARQGFLAEIDLGQSEEKIMATVRQLIDEYGETGFMDRELMARTARK